VTPRRLDAFTLLELLVVLALLAALLALAAPSFSGFGRRQSLDAHADRLLAAMLWARSEAVVACEPFRLVIADDGSAYCVEPVEADDDASITRYGTMHSLPEGVTLRVESQVTFSPLGTVPPFVAELFDERGKVVRIGVTGAADPIRRLEETP
jgi:type II secretion system protein H